MATDCLQDWLLDPLFGPAEDVQGSADRLESSFRTWQQETMDMEKGVGEIESQRLRLMSACDTLRWQLEGFERAVKSASNTMGNASLEESARKRRQEFIDIIRQQLLSIEIQVRAVPKSSVAEVRIQGEMAIEGLTAPTEARSTIVIPHGMLLPGERPAPECRATLSGFLGSVSFESSSSSEMPFGCIPGGSIDASRQSSASLGLDVESATDNSGSDEEQMATPGPEMKSFPSLLQRQGDGFQGGRVQGWQCLLSWMHHLQRVTRRRQIELSKGAASSESKAKVHPEASAREDSVQGVASARIDSAQAFPVARSMSSTNLCGTEQSKHRAEWQMDMPSSNGSMSEDEFARKQQQWHLTARPRRVHTLSRPYSSRFLLACAAAVLMIAVTCYCRFSSGKGLEPRHASLLEVSVSPATSPANP